MNYHLLLLWILFVNHVVQLVSGVGTVFVSNNYTDATCNELEAQCATIRSALGIVSNNGSVLLEPGEYSGVGNEDVCLELSDCLGLHNVTVAGNGLRAEDVVIQHQEFNSSYSFAFVIRHNQISSLKSLTIRNFPPSTSESLLFSSALFGRGAVVVQQSDRFEAVDVIFLKNAAITGGALTVSNSNVTLRGCSFLANEAQQSAAAIYSFLSDLIIDECEFSHNNLTSLETQVAGYGAALHSIGEQKVFIRNSLFAENCAERAGGALYVDSSVSSSNNKAVAAGQLIITGSSFIGNYASGIGSCLSSESCNTRGGAIYSSAVLVQIFDCSFDGNYVTTSITTHVSAYL